MSLKNRRKKSHNGQNKDVKGWGDIDKMEKTATENQIVAILKKYPKAVLFVGLMFLLYVADLVLTFLMAFKVI